MAEPTPGDIVAGTWAVLDASIKLITQARQMFQHIADAGGVVMHAEALTLVETCDALIATSPNYVESSPR